ncbi:RNA-binding S4 domain-containing protein [Pseudonocardia sp. KRD291]|uniref:RNA-binding S4 domain-containing protein n=1 Tax=Pseudonocardia sp. KRD291 TaxID=2792007 RepID=UPI001CF7BDAD|nr:RNA-binding S4 domain-containing protein [Pseudonocardia sp. KRD291]
MSESARQSPARGAAPIMDVPIDSEPIRIGQFLKLAGLAEDGGHARELLESGDVTLNGRPENRRGAQLKAGDVVAVAGTRVRPTVG